MLVEVVSELFIYLISYKNIFNRFYVDFWGPIFHFIGMYIFVNTA